MLWCTSNFSWGDKLCIVYLWGPCVRLCTFQLHCSSSNLVTTQDMNKFIDKMSNGNGLQGLTCWAASFWNLLGLRACLQFGQSPCNPIKNSQECHAHLPQLASMHWSLVPYSPACDLRTLGLTYITSQSSLHSVPYISLFRDGNNPGKPFCTALLSFAPAFLGYDRNVHNHICVLACNDPLLYRCG